MLVNARHVKNLPGRKTDVSDATWLAQLGAHGLVRGSFVPPEPIRQLRDLTRARTAITRERGREAQRLEKLLEDAGIKLSAVASDILGVSGRQMLEALIAGNHDPVVLADLAKRRLRSKIPELTEALTGRFSRRSCSTASGALPGRTTVAVHGSGQVPQTRFLASRWLRRYTSMGVHKAILSKGLDFGPALHFTKRCGTLFRIGVIDDHRRHF
jgi:hypothetical protein